MAYKIKRKKPKNIKTEIVGSALSPHYSVYVTRNGIVDKHDFFTKQDAERFVKKLKKK